MLLQQATFIGLIISFIYLYLSIPFYNGLYYTITTTDDIKIYREDNGIPHIQATNLNDAFYGLGFVHAQDRLWQMQLRRMTSQGRLSEIFGYNEEVLILDKFVRNLGYLESCKRIVDQLDSNTKQLMQAYVNGINEGYKALLVLPIEFQLLNVDFEEWTIYDSMAFVKLMALANVHDQFSELMRSKFDNIYGREIAKVISAVGPENQFETQFTVIDVDDIKDNSLFNATKQQKNITIDEEFFKKSMKHYLSQTLFPTFSGSNSWAVHGNFTKSGKPHLANDPHLENGMPTQWYQAEILFGQGEDENFIIGATLPGLPITITGRSKYFGWGQTTLNSDGGDIFEEQLKYENGQHYYLYDNKWHKVRYTEELIEIKGKEPLVIDLMHTHRGPILEYYRENGQLTDHKGKYYSLQTIIHVDDILGVDGYIKFQTCKDFLKCIHHMKKISYPNGGLVFISKEGHIAYMASGKLVVRNGHPDENGFVKEGWSTNKDWIRYLNEEEQPLIINPKKGFIVSGNNKFIPDQSKYHLSWNNQPTARGKRLTEYIQSLIDDNTKLTIEHHINLQNDVTDSYIQATLPLLIDIISKYQQYDGVQRNLTHPLKILKQWNCQLNINSNAALLYSTFEYIYALKFNPKLDENIFKLWYGKLYIFDSFYFKNIVDLHKENKDKLNSIYCQGSQENKCIMNMVISLEEAYKQLVEKYGKDSTQWQWGNEHHQYFPHAMSKYFGWLFDRKIPYKGNQRTAHVSLSKPDGKFTGMTGANYKMIISMDDDEPNYYIVDTGVSGNVFSKHYDDQQQLWSKGEYIQMKFGRRDDYENVIIIRTIGNDNYI